MAAGSTRHVPLRRCAVCRSTLPQAELIRFARDDAGRWRLDEKRRAGGRGAWLCHQERCHDRKALGRAFKAQAADVAAQLTAATTGSRKPEERETSRNGGIDV